MVQNWYTGGASWEKGVIFTWQNATATEMEKCFASTEYSIEAYRPQIVVEYADLPTVDDGIYYLDSGVEGYLSAATSAVNNQNVKIVSGTGANINVQLPQMWRVKHIQNGYYTIRPYQCTFMGLSSMSASAVTYDIGYNDEMSIPSTALWKIRYATGKGTSDERSLLYR